MFVKVENFSIESTTIVSSIIVNVKGGRDNNGRRQLLIADGEGEFDCDVLIFDNNFKTKYEQFLKAYNRDQCVMVFDKVCGNNIQKRLIFEGKTIHNSHNGC